MISDDLPTEPLSTAQVRVLWAFQHLHAHYGRATIREVMQVTGLLSPMTVHAHAQRLVAAGYLHHHPDQAPAYTPVHTLVAEGARSDQ